MNSSPTRLGTLYLVPAPLDFGCDTQAPLEDALPSGTLQAASRLTHWICENAKSTRAYLKRIDAVHPLAAPLQQQVITELPREVHKKGDHGDKGSAPFDARPLLAAALGGQDMGLVSEAGMPAVADPGSSVVRAAHDLGIAVVPLVGPVSLLLALAASGLNGQNFAFVGYLPQDSQDRQHRIKELEALAHKTGQTQLFIETPYRNAAIWQALVQGLQPHTRLALASGLTLAQARVQSQPVHQWRQQSFTPDNRTPVVFALGR
ncbi:SAM-dependent methyltransferase [Acidovorax sp. BL-A-41-H1]|uniref:SAM-dependent methyltransferase n=1 Tax=Acidovorax sp. BL-A-41-H1 TaxID=3421102 RepID=UPI003F795898